jgi:hypothetical protein
MRVKLCTTGDTPASESESEVRMALGADKVKRMSAGGARTAGSGASAAAISADGAPAGAGWVARSWRMPGAEHTRDVSATPCSFSPAGVLSTPGKSKELYVFTQALGVSQRKH